MRELLLHVVVGKVANLKVVAADERDPVIGCNHRYVITGFNTRTNPAYLNGDGLDETVILFQNGTVGEDGPNGNMNEPLLAVLIDRLRGFEGGQFACHENHMALIHLEHALFWLQERTRNRLARNVEGTHQK